MFTNYNIILLCVKIPKKLVIVICKKKIVYFGTHLGFYSVHVRYN